MKLTGLVLALAVIMLVPAAFAANGDGTVISYMPLSEMTGDTKDISVEFFNDGNKCLDELIFTAPSTWSGTASVSEWSRGGTSAITVLNEADINNGGFSDTVNDSQSVRILPTSAGGKLLCAGEKVNFTVSGLTAPGAPEVSTFNILTSDVFSNEYSVTAVRALIDPPQVVIRVTSAEDIMIKYIQRGNLLAGSGIEHEFTATAKGGWSRIEELYVERTSGASTMVDVYLDNGDGIFTAADFLVAGGAALTGPGTIDTIPLLYTSIMDVPTKVEDGYIKDLESIKFYIDLNAGGALAIRGHDDSVKMPDPSSIGTGFEATTEGTVISVGGATRTIFAQLVRENPDDSSQLLDVLDDSVRVHFSTDLGSFIDPSPKATTNKGQVELSLKSGTIKGIAHVMLIVNMLPGDGDEEFVGFNAGAPASWDVTEGDTSTSVIAGDVQRIEATIYDIYGNVITNVPSRPDVSFNLLSSPPAVPPLLGAGIDDDDIPDGYSSFHDELSDQGIGDANLRTSTTAGDHFVQVCVAGVTNKDNSTGGNCKTVTIHGVVGPPAKLVVEAPSETTANACIVATVKVTDKNGNVLDVYKDPITGHDQQWSSLVRVELTDPLWTDQEAPFGGNKSRTYIKNSSFLEEEFLYEDGFANAVQGKLTDGQGTVTICGCQGLGTFDIEANSDTLEQGVDFVSVDNARPTCISVELDKKDNNLLACEPEAQIDVSVLDACGNLVVDQECGAGNKATTCVTLDVTDPKNLIDLSTNTVCVDITDTGHAAPLDLIRTSDQCGEVSIDVFPQQQCCVSGFPTNLPVCEVLDITLIGEPVNITSSFQAERNGESIPDKGSDIVSEPIIDTFYAVDACKNVVEDFNGELDVQLKGKDCVSFIEVDGPADVSDSGVYCEGTPSCEDLTSQGQDVCQNAGCTWDINKCTGDADSDACESFTFDQCWELINGQDGDCRFIDECRLPEEPVFKLVIDNCGVTEKQWTDLEKMDIMVDKLAFTFSAPDYDSIWFFVYRETEETPGFQSGEDELVAKIPADNVGSNPGGLSVGELKATDEYFGADWYSRGTEPIGTAGDEREGGVLIRAGDTSDFYVVLKTSWSGGSSPVACGVYDVNFAFYQDYTNADIIDREFSGTGEDYDLGADDHNYIVDGDDSRNNNYPVNGDNYGFGDKFLNNLDFFEGTAWIKFRDLTAEKVEVWLSDVHMRGKVCEYQEEAEEGICYTRNDCSGPLPDSVTKEDCQDVRGESWRDSEGVCHDVPQPDASLIPVQPNPETITFSEQLATQVVMINHDGFDEKPVGICLRNGSLEFNNTENAFLINLQTADGFQNPHGKALPVKLTSCLSWEFFKFNEKGEIFTDGLLDNRFDWDNDHCVDKEEFRQMLEDEEIFEEFTDYRREILFGDFFGPEFSAWLDNFFTNAKVEFWNAAGTAPLPKDADGNYIAVTDSNGRAQALATSRYAGFYRVTATPYGLDADYTFVNFGPNIPEKMDTIAVPAFGVPADGEQEAQIWLRALDSCGNIVTDNIDDVTVTAAGKQVVISEDFQSRNNYDNNVTGDMTFEPFTLLGFGKIGTWLGGDRSIRVLDDFPETATITVSAPGLKPDTTTVVFQGAPTKLKIVSITPSDRLPADGMTGAWLTIEVQDMIGNRVTGYLGKGFAGDPLDPTGLPDYRFENICIDMDDADASIPPWFMAVDDTRFGVTGITSPTPSEYCFNLWFGRGSLYITYDNPDNNHGGTVNVQVWDKEPWQGQEINENGLPASDKTTQLDPDTGTIDFVDPPTQWNIESFQQVVLADGVSAAEINVQVENDFMDVRDAIMGNLYVGGKAEPGVEVSWNGEVDELNPTKARFLTDPITGHATLYITSTEPGTAEITVVGGDAYVCDPPSTRRITWLDNSLLDPLFEKTYRDCGYSVKKDLTPKTITIEFLEVASNQIALQPGWNFVSVPRKLNNTPNASTLFPTATGFYAWNPNTQTFNPSTATLIQPLNGYWVQVPTTTVITLTYAVVGVETPPVKSVVPGWNTVGLSLESPMVMENALISIDPIYTSVIDWNEMIQRYALPVANVAGGTQFTTDGAIMEPKQGYWIWSTGTRDLQGWTV